ncbi:asparagine synthase (glutamine-hydrolyzing) [Psychroserpens mesophilus]|uniref:asparagine synthase (glutamine-hydrolyzing) n=1 Tax=Psychroserpens mesophilus TaxID=325473 RepID=UPI000590C5DE|nr:asparagine synthase (glutamine-hydrolyzing) [Psychroserpens mesophilus]
MCGFLAEFSFENQACIDLETFENILALSKHRGPDNTSVSKNTNFQLGFNRLAILDISENGNQPKVSPSGRYHMVFNGEIYNFKQLSESYQLNNLNSTSDTEVISHLLDKVGIQKTISLLNGMFAITIIDTQNKLCFLSRDFAGIKPLFYGINENGIVAASQFNQVYKHPWFKNILKLRADTVKEYFGFGYMQAPNTIYHDIYQVNPGELIQIDTFGNLTKTQLVSFKKNNIDTSNSSKVNLEDTLTDAVKRQLISDVSVATFLSGGIDSPLISAYAKKAKPDIEAFTIKVNDPTLNESDIAKSYAEVLQLQQIIVSVEDSDILNSIDNHFYAYTEPFGDYSSIPTYVITREAKSKHTVMLSGDGGDELFYGYPRMRDVLNKRFWFKMPFPIRKLIAKVTNTLGITKTWAPYFKTFDAFVTNKHLHLSQAILDKAFPKVGFSKDMQQLYQFKNTSRKQLLQQLRWNEFYAHMQRILIKVDRASMQHSLEVRVPFLDKKSIEKAWELTSDLKDKTDLKKPLKELLNNEIPESIINTKKMGFSVPLHDWLHTTLKTDVHAHVFDKPFYGESIINVPVLQQYVKDFYDKKHHNSWGVWHIYAWQKWAAIHV